LDRINQHKKLSGMKKRMIVLAVVIICSTKIFAQTYVEFVPTAGYTFNDRIGFNNSYGKIDGSANYGGSFIFNINRSIGFDLLYSHLSTTSGFYDYNNNNQGATKISSGNLNLDYIMLGPVQTFNIPNSPVRPFIGAMLGASIFTPGILENANDVKFTWGLQAGTNIYFNPWLGLRLKAQLLAPVDGSNGGFYAGNNSAGQAVETYPANVLQFSLNAGLVIGLGRELPQLRPHRYSRRPRYRPAYPPPYRYY
jgi:hypothetical protein